MAKRSKPREASLPSVSVIIPFFNGEAFLREAVASVRAQSLPPTEVILIDDGSTDGSLALARSLEPHVKVYTQPNQGAAMTRNRGVRLASGYLLAFLDADDLWEPQKLERQVRAFAEQPELDMVFSHIGQFRSPELGAVAGAPIPNEVLPGLSHCTMLIRRESYLRVGDLDPQWKVGEFIDWYARATEQGLKAQMLPELLVRRRIHGNNMGIREKRSSGDYARIIKAALDRRRAAG